MTHLRQIMIEELRRRNYAESTIDAYIHTVEHFSRHFHRSPDQLGPEHIRQYQAALLTRWKLSPNTVTGYRRDVEALAVFQARGSSSLRQATHRSLRRFIAQQATRGYARSSVARRVAAVRPIEDAIFDIELQIYRFRQIGKEEFDIAAVGRGLAFGNFDVRAKNAAAAAFSRSLLRPIDFAAFGINRDPHTPFRCIGSGTRIASTGIHEGSDL